MQTQTVKIPCDVPDASFSKRERIINVGIQKQIELFNSQGLMVVEHVVLRKAGTFASVQFKLAKMFQT